MLLRGQQAPLTVSFNCVSSKDIQKGDAEATPSFFQNSHGTIVKHMGYYSPRSVHTTNIFAQFICYVPASS